MMLRFAMALLALTAIAWTSHSTAPAPAEATAGVAWAPLVTQSTGEAADLAFARLTGQTLAQGTSSNTKPKGSRCSANGAPACGGSCSIECEPGKRARCVSGSCNPNMPYSCVCERTSYCGCE
jgi:hypothetical protein